MTIRELTVPEFTRELDAAVSEAGENNTPALESCEMIIRASVEENFQTATTARGEAWPERKDPKPTHPLLILEGELMAAATAKGAGASMTISDGKVLEISMDSGPTGTSRAGIRRHEFGDEEIMGKPGIRARPYFGVSSEAADACADTVADAVVEQLLAGL